MTRNDVLNSWLLTGLVAFIALLINLPVILMVLNSFQTTEQILASDASFLGSCRSPTTSRWSRPRRSSPTSGTRS